MLNSNHTVLPLRYRHTIQYNMLYSNLILYIVFPWFFMLKLTISLVSNCYCQGLYRPGVFHFLQPGALVSLIGHITMQKLSVKWEPAKKPSGDKFTNLFFFFTGMRTWMINHLHSFLSDAITHPCPNFNVGWNKPPLKLGHRWTMTSYCFTWLWLFIHGSVRKSYGILLS